MGAVAWQTAVLALLRGVKVTTTKWILRAESLSSEKVPTQELRAGAISWGAAWPVALPFKGGACSS